MFFERPEEFAAYRTDFSKGNPIHNLIKQQKPLEAFFEANDVLYYLHTNNELCQQPFIDYMQKSDQVTLLLDYCLYPDRILDKRKNQTYEQSCKYAFMSIQVFDILKQDIVEEDSGKYLQYLFKYLDQDELDSTTSQNFGAILFYIFSQENVVRWILQPSNQNFLEKFVKHVSNKQIAQQICDIITWDVNNPQKFKCIELLLKKFEEETEDDSEALQNIAFIFTEILRQVEDNQMQIQVYARLLISEDNIARLFTKIIKQKNSQNIYYITHTILFTIKNFEVRFNMGDIFIKYIDPLVNMIFTVEQNARKLQTSYDQPLQIRFGVGKLKAIEIFCGFLMFFPHNNDLMLKIAESQFYPLLLSSFFEYTTNTLFSFYVEKAVLQALDNNNPALNKCLLERCNIDKLVVENFKKSKIFTQYGIHKRTFKKSHVGSLIKIAIALQSETKNKDVQDHLAKSKIWEEFNKNKLQELTKREQIEWQELEEMNDNLGDLPQLEHKWISYQIESQHSSSNNLKQLGAKDFKIQQMNSDGSGQHNSNNMSIEQKKNREDSQGSLDLEDVYDLPANLKLVKVKSSEVPILNYNDPKEMLIHCALYGCGDLSCQNQFCRSNKEFSLQYKHLNESNVSQILTNKNITNFEPCKRLQEMKKKEDNQKVPIRHQVIKSQEDIDYSSNSKPNNKNAMEAEEKIQYAVIKIQQGNETFYLKASGLQPNDKKLIKDVGAAVHLQNDQTQWHVKEIQREGQKNIYQIINKHYGYSLQMGQVYSNDKIHQDVGLGQPPDSQSVADLWFINKIPNSESSLYSIKNMQSKSYLMISTQLANNAVDKDVALQKEINDKSSWSVKLIAD